MKADGEQAMDFQEADRRYAELKQQYEMGEINPEEFDAKLRDMMVRTETAAGGPSHAVRASGTTTTASSLFQARRPATGK